MQPYPHVAMGQVALHEARDESLERVTSDMQQVPASRFAEGLRMAPRDPRVLHELITMASVLGKSVAVGSSMLLMLSRAHVCVA